MPDETGLFPCDRCGRPSKRRALWYRDSQGVARMAGRYGKKHCFYIVARRLVKLGFQPEDFDARPIVLRGSK
jgi:hypothetical protein